MWAVGEKGEEGQQLCACVDNLLSAELHCCLGAVQTPTTTTVVHDTQPGKQLPPLTAHVLLLACSLSVTA